MIGGGLLLVLVTAVLMSEIVGSEGAMVQKTTVPKRNVRGRGNGLSKRTYQLTVPLNMKPVTKRLILVRHAQSEENTRIENFRAAWTKLRTMRPMTGRDLWSFAQVMVIEANAQLSEKGRGQAQDLGERLAASNFIHDAGIELAVHSPLVRTRMTLQAILKNSYPEVEAYKGNWGEGVSRDTAPIPVVMAEDLREKRPREHIPGPLKANFKNRAERFLVWLLERPESTILVVGHGQMFKRLLGTDWQFGNCDLRETTLSRDNNGGITFEKSVLQYRGKDNGKPADLDEADLDNDDDPSSRESTARPSLNGGCKELEPQTDA